MKVLQDKYVCTWILPGELKAMKDESESPKLKRVATELLERYRPLVEICRLDKGGNFQASLSMNEDIIDRFGSSRTPSADEVGFFLTFLQSGLDK